MSTQNAIGEPWPTVRPGIVWFESSQRIPVPTGWICPRCGRGMAPTMPSCPCGGHGTGSAFGVGTLPTTGGACSFTTYPPQTPEDQPS